MAPLLEMRAISKRFGATQALSNVSLELRRGEVHALLGENGAGKSTLIKIMTGVQSPDSGEILLDGTPIHLGSSQDAQRHGIAAMYQEPMIFPDLSVAENIFIGHRNRGRVVDRRKMEKEATEVLSRLGVQIDVDEPYASYLLATGAIQGAAGESFEAGRMGTYTIELDPTRPDTGALRVVMGPFSVYNKDNPGA